MQGKEKSQNSKQAPDFHFAIFLYVLGLNKSELICIPLSGCSSLTDEVSNNKLWVYLKRFSQKVSGILTLLM